MGSKRWNGYFTIEASFIMPLVLFLYLAVVSAALFLYNRCVVSQDSFLLGMRVAAFTRAEENYGEVIYGEREQTELFAEEYAADRWARKQNYYLGDEWKEFICITEKDYIQIAVCGKADTDRINKKIQILNPVNRIRERRKNVHASGKVL